MFIPPTEIQQDLLLTTVLPERRIASLVLCLGGLGTLVLAATALPLWVSCVISNTIVAELAWSIYLETRGVR